MRTCQLGKGRNCREGEPHKQGNWRIFEQSETLYPCTRPIAGMLRPVGAAMPEKIV
ncbi:hypothetical protein D3C71_2058610 [compost metagenome]